MHQLEFIMHFMGRVTSPLRCQMCALTPCSSGRRTTRPSPLHLYRRNHTHLQIQPQKYKGTCTQRSQCQPHERDIRQYLHRIRDIHIRIRHRVCKTGVKYPSPFPAFPSPHYISSRPTLKARIPGVAESKSSVWDGRCLESRCSRAMLTR